MQNSTKSKTEQLLEDVRKMPLFRQLVPQEAGVGWPIPVRKGEKVYVTLPFFGLAPLRAKGQTALHPPFATLTLTWPTLVPVEYVDLRFRDPQPDECWTAQVGTFPHPAVAGLTVGHYKGRRGELLAMYDELFDTLTANGALPPVWEERFGQSLRLLLEPGLEPYYRALAPKFFARFLDA